MKTWKLVSGIISIVLFAFVMFQSCAAGISNSLEANGESGGSAGVIVAIMLLAGGIVSIATRNGLSLFLKHFTGYHHLQHLLAL